VRVIAVSVDPRGDTFASVRRYAKEKNLLPQFRYLVGSKQDLAPVWSRTASSSTRSTREHRPHRPHHRDRPQGRAACGFPADGAGSDGCSGREKLL